MIIDICIATFRRPMLLKKLLESLNGLNADQNVSCRVIVIDNEKTCSAEKVVDEFAKGAKFPFTYDVEPVQNIALTRNRALSYASGDFVAFIDDDEFADRDWLVNHVKTLKEFQADAVCGPVIPVYEEGVPEWIKQGRFFEKKRHQNGALLTSGATNNALVDRNKITTLGLKFQEKFGLTGGEDTDFFQSLINTGARLVWCDKALVYEHVPKERACGSWLIKRAFRSGQTFASVMVPQMTFTKKSFWFLKRITYFILSYVAVPFSVLLGRTMFVRALMQAAKCTGQLASRSCLQYRHYAVKS